MREPGSLLRQLGTTRAAAALLGAFLASAVGQAQPATLVKDIYPGTVAQAPSVVHGELVVSGNLAYFVSTVGGSGPELWKTDGTAAGTTIVAHLPSGSFLTPFSGSANLTDVNGTLFFTTTSLFVTTALWKTDGTAAGTQRLLDTGSAGSLRDLHNVAGTLLFFKNYLTTEIWRSDGTPAGTVPISTVGALTGQSATAGSTLYFGASDSLHGAELWKSDGTAGGTGLVLDISPGAMDSNPSRLIAVGAKIFFSACEPQHGCELWKSDGTATGTVLVKDLSPGPASSQVYPLAAFNGFLFFETTEPNFRLALQITDGTDAGTVLLRTFAGFGTFASGPGFASFVANDGLTGYELWKTDGTMAGTVQLADILPGPASSSPAALAFVGPVLYFTAQDAVRGFELWKSDGTPSGASAVRDVAPSGQSPFQSFQGKLLFFGNDNDGATGTEELWTSDGTEAGTIPYFSYSGPLDSSPTFITPLGSEVFFAATDDLNGQQVWKTDGTALGTQLLTCFDRFAYPQLIAYIGAAGTHVFVQSQGALWSIASGATQPVRLTTPGTAPVRFGVLGQEFFFTAYRATPGMDLWKSDGTPAGTQLVADLGSASSNPGSGLIVDVGGVGYFVVTINSGDQLWRTDGTAAGTALVKTLPAFGTNQLTSFGGLLYFAVPSFPATTIWKSDGTPGGTVSVIPLPAETMKVAGSTLFFSAFHPMTGSELWMTDGTLNGTHLVKDIQTGTQGSNPGQLVALGNVLYFVADDGVHGAELWRSDGTDVGTTLVADLRPGSGSSEISGLTTSNGLLFFSASVADTGTELWRSDGTSGGTTLVADIYPGALSSSPDSLTDAGGQLYFTASDPQNGRELWQSDGTPAGTTLVRNVRSELANSHPRNGIEAGGLLYFAATSAQNGTELWRSDGTASGTFLVKDLIPGKYSGNPSRALILGSKIIFWATDETLGSVLWISDGTSTGTLVLKVIKPPSSPFFSVGFVPFLGKLFFVADDGVHGAELWVTDGTTAGTSLFLDVVPGKPGGNVTTLQQAGGFLYFSATAPAGFPTPMALWRSDGTPGGTSAFLGAPQFGIFLIQLGSGLYYLDSTTQGRGLWRTDGTAAGTQQVASIYPGAPFVSLGGMIASGGSLYFFVSQTGTAYELWKSDGTSSGTLLVTPGLGAPGAVTDVNGLAFFVADDGTHGRELWRTDGTAAGTYLVRDIRPGPDSSEVDSPINVGGRLLFWANDGLHGPEPWVSDGTPTGTVLLQDINPGPGSSRDGYPFSLVAIAGTRVFFSADDSQTGTELWSLPMSAICTPPSAPTIHSTKSPSCGDAVVLDAGPGYAAYLWSTNETTRTITVSPLVTTTYSVYTSNASGCRSSSSFIQAVDPALQPPASLVSNNGPVCVGQTLQLMASTVPGASYLWTGPNAFSSTAQNPTIAAAQVTASGTYQVVVTVGTCRSVTAATTAAVHTVPDATIHAPADACSGSTGLTASVAFAGGGATYAWTIVNGTITSGSGTPTITFDKALSGDVGLSVTVTDSNGCSASNSATVSTSSSCFYTLPPCRMIDTRTTDIPALAAGGDRTFILTGRCGLPATARSVSINIAVTETSSDGHLTLYPAGGTLPASATINYSAGQTRANNAILPLGPSGDIIIHCQQGSGTTQVIIDVNGYFEP